MAEKKDPAPPIRVLKRRLVAENTVLRIYFDHIAQVDKEVAD